MARPEEKAQSMLNRYLRSQKDKSENTRRRPHLASLCTDLNSGVKWRSQVERDIRLRVTEIHNDSLPKERVRELNDTINRLLRERRHWDRRVVQLGGRSIPHGSISNTSEGFEHGGYLYFGAARDLPEVRDLLERRKKNLELLAAENDDEDDPEKLYGRLTTEYYNPVYTENDEKALKECGAKLEEKLKSEFLKLPKNDTPSEWDKSYEMFIGVKPKQATGTSLLPSRLGGEEIGPSGVNAEEKRGDEVGLELKRKETIRKEQQRKNAVEMLGAQEQRVGNNDLSKSEE